MKSRSRLLWAAIRDGLWFIPAVTTLMMAGGAVVLVWAETAGRVTVSEPLLLGGGAEAARALLSAVAGGLITVTGVVFSVTVVVLQLSSTQFSPRVLPNFMSDRANQAVLGILIGTFTYCLIVLRVVDSPETLPRLSIAVAMGLAVISVAALIFFINHAARSIQISVILHRASEKALAQVDRLFPEDFGREDQSAPREETVPDEHAVIRSRTSGYIQALDEARIFAEGGTDTVVWMEQRIGSFVLKGQPVARVSPPEAASRKLERSLLKALVIGHERTVEADYELSLIELSDVAVKALSPGINDPTTAQHCIDRLSDLLLALATRHAPSRKRTKDGRLHLVVKNLPFDLALRSSFSQIIHFGGSNEAIRSRLLERVDTLLELVPAARRPPLAALREHLV